MNDKGQIIIYNSENSSIKVEVKLIDNNVWLNQDQIVTLYQSSKSNISEHIKHILEEGELDSNSVVRNFRITATDGKIYNVKHYNLDMIIAIGYRVRSNIGTNFRKWATNTLNEYMTKGFALNDNLLKEAGGGRYFKELLARIRDIRSSEKVFWRQVLEIFATSVDYDPKSDTSVSFFKTVQNKMHWAAHGHTAAEIIKERADSEKDFMGLTTFNGDYPLLEDAVVAKNYLTKEEMEILNRIVSLYLDFAELQALEQHVMTMNDWAKELDYFLTMTRKDILNGPGLVSHQEALEHARKEYDEFKERLFIAPTENEKTYLSHFDELILIEKKEDK
ncbi:MAG: virulence RhuM family protein [Gammaproteobacteria bacterium]|nr:virulence RhuM family protein [Gammaproteobacteria bacterium]